MTMRAYSVDYPYRYRPAPIRAAFVPCLRNVHFRLQCGQEIASAQPATDHLGDEIARMSGLAAASSQRATIQIPIAVRYILTPMQRPAVSPPRALTNTGPSEKMITCGGASMGRCRTNLNDGQTSMIPAVPTDPGVVRSDTDPGRSGDDRCVLVAAGQEIEKLPLRELSRPMPGHRPIAAVARPDRQRPLRPRTGRPASVTERPVPDR